MNEPVQLLSFLVFYQENTPVHQGFVENWSRLWQWEQMRSSNNLCMIKYLFLNKQMTEHNSLLLLFDILLSAFKCWFSFGSLFSVFKCFIFSFDPTISFHFPFQLFSTLKKIEHVVIFRIYEKERRNVYTLYISHISISLVTNAKSFKNFWWWFIILLLNNCTKQHSIICPSSSHYMYLFTRLQYCIGER